MNALQLVHQHLRSLATIESGSAAIEYAVLTGLIAVALAGAISELSGGLIALATYLADELARAIVAYSS